MTGTGAGHTRVLATSRLYFNGSWYDQLGQPRPIPGSLVLFLSGLGLLGFWGWAKGRKGGSGSASFEAAAC